MFDQPAGIIEHLCVFKFFLVVLKNALVDAVCSCAIVQKCLAIVQKCLAIVWYLSKLMTEQTSLSLYWIQNRCTLNSTVIGPSLTPYL